jgi:16S rRNA (uracil1498-N3)-methyltransferase
MSAAVRRAAATRLYVPGPLAPGANVALDAARAHFLRDVLRLVPGDPVTVFDGANGEFAASISALSRGGGTLVVAEQLRVQAVEQDLWLLFAPLKHQRLDYLVEKATELGVSRLVPVITRRTVVGRVNVARLVHQVREASEQCERLTVPDVVEPEPLARAIAGGLDGRRLFLCAESGDAPSLAAVLREGAGPIVKAAITIGPEGGFDPAELDFLRDLPFVTPVSLGPRVLRAETAAVAALAVFQSIAGDWKRPRAPV